jgi:hypothetical protein
MSDNVMFGIGQLRDRRGSETVTFDEVADLLVAFVDHNPDEGHAIDSLGSFLAKSKGTDDVS